MTPLLIIAGIVGPALFWAAYFYYKDKHQPEPLKYLGISYLLGIFTAFLCYLVYFLLPKLGIPEDPSILMQGNKWLFLIYTIGVVGILEEVFKFLPFFLFAIRLKDFDEKVDGIVYSSIIALGFASFENFQYLAHMEGFELFGRAVASPLTHTIFSSIWGYTVGIAYLSKKSLVNSAITGILLAALFHGLFDFLTLSSVLRVISALIILFIWIWRISKMEKLVEDHKKETAGIQAQTSGG